MSFFQVFYTLKDAQNGPDWGFSWGCDLVLQWGHCDLRAAEASSISRILTSCSQATVEASFPPHLDHRAEDPEWIWHGSASSHTSKCAKKSNHIQTTTHNLHLMSLTSPCLKITVPLSPCAAQAWKWKKERQRTQLGPRCTWHSTEID